MWVLLMAAPQAVVGQQATALDGPDIVQIEPASYHDHGRRDPFVPLTSGADPGEGPRFETLRLTGVFLGSPGNSLVVLEDPMRRGHFTRVGEKIGNARLLAIHSESADFEVDDYGSVRQESLRLERADSDRALNAVRPGRTQ
jgi:hypothetical protein